MLLKENPFYILDVSLSSNRRRIAEAADEIGFLLGAEICSEAQSVLTNPGKRLAAEIGWFPEASEKDIVTIRNAISGGQPIATAGLHGYSRLNALVYNLGIEEYSSIYELGFAIVEIDDEYSRIDLSKVLQIINRAREAAGIAAATENELQECHRSVIEEIRKIINEKLRSYDEKTYIDFVTVVAEQYIADKRDKAGRVLFDIVDQYEIRMQSEIENRANQIIQYVDLIKSENNIETIKQSIPKVIARVRDWDVFAQPLQLRSQATGLPHEISSKLALEMRGLCLFLNNEKQLVSEAKTLATAMKAVFLELGEFKEIFTEDEVKLGEIEEDSKNAEFYKEIQADFEKIEAAGKKMISQGLEPEHINDLVRLVQSTNRKILDCNLDQKSKNQLRTALCFRARKIAIDTHNDAHNSLVAKYLICVLTDMFKDLKEPESKLKGDLNALRNDTLSSTVTMSNYHNFFDKYIGPKAARDKHEEKKRRSRIYIAVVVIFFIIIAIANNSSKNNSSSRSSYGSSYGSTSTKTTSKPTAKTTSKPTTKPTSKTDKATEKVTAKPTAKPTTRTLDDMLSKEEKVYSSGNYILGNKVKEKVVLIEPKYGIYSSVEGKPVSSSTTYHDYVCQCTTESGKKVWISFPASDYISQIDSSVDRYVNSSTDGFNGEIVRYYPAATLHGKIVQTRSVMSDLYLKIVQINIMEFTSIDIPSQQINIKSTVSVKTIFPSYTVTSGNSSVVTHVLCEYTDSVGKKNWIYMSVEDYKKYFDSTANLGSGTYANEKKFTTAKKVTVVSDYIDDLIDGASAKIGQKIVYVLSGTK